MLGSLNTAFSTMAAWQTPRFTTHTPIPQGPHVVGCVDIMMGRCKDGTLMRLYYPCKVSNLQSQAHNWTPWFLGDEYTRGLASFIAPSIPSLFSMLFNWKMRNVATPAVWEAALMKTQKWPVVVFSHGLSANRSIYSTVCSELASHGFVVAVEHRDSSACASFVLNEDGKRDYILYKTLPPDVKEYELRSQQIKVRVEESIRALDALEKLNQGQAKNELPSTFDLQQLCDALDLSHPVMSGHSFGGVTAITTLAMDKRFKIGVSLDPWMFPIKDRVTEVCGNVSQPLICISTEAFQSDANLQAMSSLPADTTTFVTIKGTVHQNQCDTPFLVGNIGRAFVGVYSPLDAHTAMDINNRLMLNFIAKHLEGQSQLYVECKTFLSDWKELIPKGLYGAWPDGFPSKL
ncbi:platelet-activating factor acetylhydrolase-like isoform X2 [Portunus trituberculatus]|uniref:platelet-activating factor acetylhydrolase-like isoform X2 n=1 Tax=Portunus trituberculatus TaxID=210409 RepID=UPI001E1D0BEF|nr:platelet-activating factor acetylhydrolase-like isoform X2 [Portunus trituberculatus]XP_045116477.1 platelet-activating factor acetylhydrolase-like isoform X2 [Portunus trituberculatus]XP_045116487.1 platelet-activating factor acetylhydrolase-like isoform X2 [Portunus trituberculatus]XP_045116496.1 platelet-activating factor acetylhydrolase-like isoform X2 [Portunus trituberculatus]